MENLRVVKVRLLGWYAPRPRYELTLSAERGEIVIEGFCFGEFQNGTALFHFGADQTRSIVSGWILVVKKTGESADWHRSADVFHIPEAK